MRKQDKLISFEFGFENRSEVITDKLELKLQFTAGLIIISIIKLVLLGFEAS